MSLGSAIGGGFKSIGSGLDLSSTRGTTLTANASANTLGTFVEILSAANNLYSSNEIEITCSDFSASTGTDAMMVVLAVGGAGSEEIIVPDLLCRGVTGSIPTYYKYSFPINIPAGVRISIACQSRTGGQVIDVNVSRSITCLSQDLGLAIIDPIGSTRSTGRGIEVARSATINTFGSWVEITASLAKSIKGFAVCGMRSNTSWSNGVVTYEVGVGSAGNEVAIYDGGLIMTTTSEEGVGNVSPFRSVGISAGTRISIRAQGDINNTDLDFDYIIYGAR